MSQRPDMRSDVDLLRDSRSDPEAFGVLYDRHERAVLAYLARRTASAEDAADLAAETFAAAFLARRRYVDTGAPVLAWLLGMTQQFDAAARKEWRAQGGGCLKRHHGGHQCDTGGGETARQFVASGCRPRIYAPFAFDREADVAVQPEGLLVLGLHPGGERGRASGE
jgi:hypothetical protein